MENNLNKELAEKQDIVNYYNKRQLEEADKLLLETAKNNFNAGFQAGEKSQHLKNREIFEEMLESLGGWLIINYNKKNLEGILDKLLELKDQLKKSV